MFFNVFLLMYVFLLKKHAKLKGIDWDSDTDSDCEWNILAVFCGISVYEQLC